MKQKLFFFFLYSPFPLLLWPGIRHMPCTYTFLAWLLVVRKDRSMCISGCWPSFFTPSVVLHMHFLGLCFTCACSGMQFLVAMVLLAARGHCDARTRAHWGSHFLVIVLATTLFCCSACWGFTLLGGSFHIPGHDVARNYQQYRNHMITDSRTGRIMLGACGTWGRLKLWS